MTDTEVGTVVDVHSLMGEGPVVGALTTTVEPIIHGIVGAQFGDLEFDVGKSVRWTQWFVDDLFIMDINVGDQRYWVINWSVSFPEAEYGVSGQNFFRTPVSWRQEQFRVADERLHYNDNDWVLFIDSHEGATFDTRSLPDDYAVQPFKSWIYREVQRATDAGQTVVYTPFFVYLKYTDTQTITYPSHAGPNAPSVSQSLSVPWYLPAGYLARLIKVSTLRSPSFDWSSIDQPRSDASMGLAAPEPAYLNPSLNSFYWSPYATDLNIDGDIRITGRVRADNPALGTVSQYLYRNGGVGVSVRALLFMFSGSSTYHDLYDPNRNPNNKGGGTPATLFPPGQDVDLTSTIKLVDNGVLTRTFSTSAAAGVTQTGTQSFGSVVTTGDLTVGASNGGIGPWFGRVYNIQQENINRARLIFPNVAGNYISTPGTAPAGDQIEIVARVSHPDWDNPTPTFAGILWRNGNVIFRKTTVARQLQLVAYYGAGLTMNVNTTYAAGLFPSDQLIWLKATINSADGAGGWVGSVSYNLTNTSVEPTTWTALTGTLTGTPSRDIVPSPGSALWLGAEDPTRASRFRISRAILRNAIGAITAAAPLPQLRFPGYAGNYLSILHNANQNPAGDIEIVARVSRPNWGGTPGAGIVISKNGPWYILVSTVIHSWWGTAGGTQFPSSSPHGFTNGSTYWIKVTRVAATGLTSYYSAPDSATEPTVWTAIGTNSGNTGALVSNSSNIGVGAYNILGNPLNGRVLRAIVRSGIAGTTVIDVGEANLPATAPAVPVTSFTATAGGTVTVNEQQPTVFVFPNASGNTLTIPNSAGLQITGDIEIVCRIAPTNWAATGNYRYIFDKWNVGGTSYGIRFNNTLNSLEWLFNGTVGGSLAQQFSYTALMGNAFTDGVPVWLRFRLDVDNGSGSTVLSAEYAADFATEPVVWTNIVAPVTRAGITSVVTNTMAPTIYPYPGNLYNLIVRSGFAGTIVANIERGSAPTVGATSFVASVGGTVTVTQPTANIIQADPIFPWNPIIQGTVFDVAENNAGNMLTPTTFKSITNQTMTVTTTAGETIVYPQADTVAWRFDAEEAPVIATPMTGAKLYLPGVTGTYLSTPDPTQLAGATQLDIRWIETAPPTGVAGYNVGVILSQTPNAATNRCFSIFSSASAGSPGIRTIFYPDGLSGSVINSATLNIRPTTGTAACRVTWRSSDGRVQMFTKATSSVDEMLVNTGWVQVGTNTLGSTLPLFDSTMPLAIGAYSDGINPILSSMSALSVATTIDGTPFTLWRADALRPVYTDAYGVIWTLAVANVSTLSTEWRNASDQPVGQYTDPRGRVWKTTAPVTGVVPYQPPDTKLSVISYAYAHWNKQDIAPGETRVPDLSAENDLGYQMRNLMSLCRPIPGIPFGTPWQPPNTDPVSYPGPWAVDMYAATDPQLVATVEEKGHTPPNKLTAPVGVPLYDIAMRLNLRDGLWYERGMSGNIPLAWDETNQVWVPLYDPDTWPEMGVAAEPIPPPGPANMALLLDGNSGTYVFAQDANYFDFADQESFTLVAVIAPNSWTPASRQVIVSKWDPPSQRSWYWAIEAGGGMVLSISRDGTTPIEVGCDLDDAPGLAGLGTNQMMYVAVTYFTNQAPLVVGDPIKDTVQFWAGTDLDSWAALCAEPTYIDNPSSLNLFASFAGINVGAIDDGASLNFAGYVRLVSIRRGVAESGVGGDEVGLFRGDIVLDPAFDRYGNLWDIHGGYNFQPIPTTP